MANRRGARRELPEPWASTVTARFHAQAGPHALAMMAGFALIGVILLMIRVFTDVSLDGYGPPTIAIVAACGSIFASDRLCTRSQRRRWLRCLGVEPTETMELGLTPTAIVIWDSPELRWGDARPLVEVPRPGPTLERWPKDALGSTGLRLRVGDTTLGLSVNSPYYVRSDIDRMIAALAADAAVEVP